MKKGIALVLAAMLTLFACGAWAEEEHTDEEVQALVAEELALSVKSPSIPLRLRETLSSSMSLSTSLPARSMRRFRRVRNPASTPATMRMSWI